MTMSLLWYVLAGFLLGFAASTLWEWLYFRRKRLNWESERIENLQVQLADEQALNEQMRLAHSTVRTEPVSEYASPGVFLDSESPDVVGEASIVGPPANVDAPSRMSPSQSEGQEDTRSAQVQAASQPAGSDLASTKATRAGTISSPSMHVSASSGADVVVDEANDPSYAFAADGIEESVGIFTDDIEPASPDEAADGNADQAVVAGEAEIDGYEDETTILERLAAELAQPAEEYAQVPRGRVRTKAVARSTDYPDNLSKIKGIGDVYKYRLYEAGIYTWHQIAESDVGSLRAATHAYPGSNVEEWPGQARELAEKNGRQNAYYSGPTPDNLTQIIGIGPVSERTLYRAGICTYDQLAGATVDELRELFPIAIAGDEPDFSQWIRLAIGLANRKT